MPTHTINTSNPLSPRTVPTPVVGPNGEGATVVAYEAAFAGLAAGLAHLGGQGNQSANGGVALAGIQVSALAPGSFAMGGGMMTNGGTSAAGGGSTGYSNMVDAGSTGSGTLGGYDNAIIGSAYSATLAGDGNTVQGSVTSVALAGTSNTIVNSADATTLGGSGSVIVGANQAAVVGGVGNYVNAGATGAAVVGGSGCYVQAGAAFSTAGGVGAVARYPYTQAWSGNVFGSASVNGPPNPINQWRCHAVTETHDANPKPLALLIPGQQYASAPIDLTQGYAYHVTIRLLAAVAGANGGAVAEWFKKVIVTPALNVRVVDVTPPSSDPGASQWTCAVFVTTDPANYGSQLFVRVSGGPYLVRWLAEIDVMELGAPT